MKLFYLIIKNKLIILAQELHELCFVYTTEEEKYK